MGMSPGDRYRKRIAAGNLTEDEAQREAVALLDDLHGRLQTRQSRRRGLFRRRGDGPERGLYLWGEVGRGKTLLMDLFHESLPVDKLRMHFHRFMRQVHHDLHRLRGTSDPLRRVADGFAERARVLCFDEFFVADIGDAMILGELLKKLFDRDVTLVATSNVQPSQLYENGLQRRRFLPAIAALEKHTLIHRMGGTVDHRLRTLERAEIYHWPLDSEAERSLGASFMALAGGKSRVSADLVVRSGQHRAPNKLLGAKLRGAIELTFRDKASSEIQDSANPGRAKSTQQHFQGAVGDEYRGTSGTEHHDAVGGERHGTSGAQQQGAASLEINGRSINARQLADEVAWFDFAELCEGPRSANDYIELARCHNSVLLSNVRRFDSRSEDAARRFISLVDEFYDRNVKLIISAQTPIEDLYAGEQYQREFQRTASRLVEMQSNDYLARPHRAG